MDFYTRALELREETVAHRRWFHAHAEVGLDMPKARAYLMEWLKTYGLEPRTCGHGVTAELGGGQGKTILLRADMDALPMKEESGEPFACPTGMAAHTCGHDFHAAMLLTAAKMLKEREGELAGRVRFMFQPAEETFEGAKDMIGHGILEGVDAALAYHVGAGKMPPGLFMYNSGGPMMFSVDGFKITVHGREFFRRLRRQYYPGYRRSPGDDPHQRQGQQSAAGAPDAGGLGKNGGDVRRLGGD